MDANDLLLEELRKHEADRDFMMKLPENVSVPATDGGVSEPVVTRQPNGPSREPTVDVEAREPTSFRVTPFPKKPAVNNSGPRLSDEDGDEVAPSTTSPRAVMAQAAMSAAPDSPQPSAYPRPPTPPPDRSGADPAMEDAKAKAERNKKMARIGQSVTAFTERPQHFLSRMTGAGSGGGGQMAHNSMWDDAEKEADQPVSDLLAQRKTTADAATSAEKKDPNSATAKTYRTVLSKMMPDTDLTGAGAEQMEKMAPWIEKFAAENADALKAKATLSENERKAALHATERKEDLTNREQTHADANAIARSNNNIAQASLGLRQGADARDAAKDARDAAEKAKGHPTSPSTLTDLADAETAINELGPLGEKFKKLDMGGWWGKAAGKATDLFDLQETDAAEYKAAALRAMQGVGKIMEGGKLATSDEDKYRRMLPRPGDAPEIADQKVREAQSFLRKLKDGRIATLRAAHYDVPDVGGAAPAAGAKVRMSNGKETLDVDPADVEAAMADNFKKVPR